jgi:hypothetical protein
VATAIDSAPTLIGKSLFPNKQIRMLFSGKKADVELHILCVDCSCSCDDCVILYDSVGIGDRVWCVVLTSALIARRLAAWSVKSSCALPAAGREISETVS